jgi:putative glycosyltransferase
MRLSIVAFSLSFRALRRGIHRRVSETARQLVQEDYEIVLVNDGSPDDSLDRAIRLTQADPRVVSLTFPAISGTTRR